MNNVITQAAEAIAAAFPVTIALLAVSLASGTLIAVGYGVLLETGGAFLRSVVRVATLMFRGTPLLVQLFLVYYGFAQFEVVRTSVFWVVLCDPFWCAALVLSLNASAYTLEIFRGGIQSVSRQEIEAAKAFGMDQLQLYRTVIVPQAIRYCLPAYSNQVVAVVKNTALASTITVVEMTGASQRVMSATFAAVEVFLIAGTAYLITNTLLTLPISWLERRFEWPR